MAPWMDLERVEIQKNRGDGNCFWMSCGDGMGVPWEVVKLRTLDLLGDPGVQGQSTNGGENTAPRSHVPDALTCAWPTRTHNRGKYGVKHVREPGSFGAGKNAP